MGNAKFIRCWINGWLFPLAGGRAGIAVRPMHDRFIGDADDRSLAMVGVRGAVFLPVMLRGRRGHHPKDQLPRSGYQVLEATWKMHCVF